MRERGHLFWEYQKNFSLRVEAPTCLGVFTEEDARLREATLVRGEAGSEEEGNRVIFSWLIDKRGIVLDALFSAFGDSALIGCAELLCEGSIKKSWKKALGITSKDLAALMTTAEIPGRVRRIILLVLAARDKLLESLALSFPQEIGKSAHPEWDTLSKEDRLDLIRKAIEEYILPFLQRDGGGVEVLDLVEGSKVKILFQGACVDCIGSSGSTFSYIQHLLQHEVHPSLTLLI